MAKKTNEVKKEIKEEKKDYKYIFIQFTVSEGFKQLIEEYSKLANSNTTSHFIRESIEEKILRMKNKIPVFENIPHNSISEEKIKQLIQEAINSQNILLETKINELKKTNENLLEAIQKDLILLNSYTDPKTYEEQINLFKNLLKTHKALTINDFMKFSQRDSKECFKILSNTEIFKLNTITGRFGLK